MSDGFQVTMTDLQKAAGMFRAEAGTFAAIMPATGPASVNGGSANINDALSLALAAADGLHTQLATVIGQHGDKLDAAYGTYRDAEDGHRQDERGHRHGPPDGLSGGRWAAPPIRRRH